MPICLPFYGNKAHSASCIEPFYGHHLFLVYQISLLSPETSPEMAVHIMAKKISFYMHYHYMK